MEKDRLEVLEELECPICTDYLTIPIRQCVTGHSVCGKCIERLNKCALCRSAFTDSRNFSLEAVALKSKYPCINKHAGCTKLLSYPERKEHEIACNFQNFEIACQMKGCTFFGNQEALKCHWKEKKMCSRMFGAFNKCNLKIKQESFYVNLVEAFSRMFWFKSKISNGLLYFAMQFIGKPEEAHTFFYQIEVSHESFPKKKIIVSDYCKSIVLSNAELFKEEFCIIVFMKSLKVFLSDPESNPSLNYTMRIFKEGANLRKKKTQKYSGKPNIQRQNQASRIITNQNLRAEVGERSSNISNGTAQSLSTEHVNHSENHECCCSGFCDGVCAIL